MKDIRPYLEQRWYPKDPAELSHSIESYLKNAEIEHKESKIYGVIVPHAGHIYSGQVAAYAFNSIRHLKPKTVVVVSPSHFIGGADIIVSPHTAYSTPLGNIEIETLTLEEILKRLYKDFGITILKYPEDPEHSIEVELPFLQQIYEDFKLVPIMIRAQNEKVSKALGYVLSEILQLEDSLLIASSDLSHYYNQEIANKMDKEIIDRIESFDPESVLDAEQKGIGQACGIGAIAAVMWASKGIGAKKAEILNYATSGDVSGDYSGVVGYVSAALY
ncbi:MAG: AmmeMemoRadiSam system protein B [Candidatus Dadabacteria bacterium]|nr:AmmeMemoRadiSam system protein B [Candidatus Dadabacteria bacterium]NIS08992.1 AmmeMemoRadiSam system protein B [Candidatus Dadabacteria bacterium]NIV41035.1 AmmeMemoRadiSam system protein B [Candidatus Dadabacteria bacterium]NIX15594.1 AmmeMemoRadiSam system protein B [Candidatus Dadabacteria bacterium]NIY22335.1 AmmeMemoRadiSam system protein B [Candidatus Dadabacteria bacterium]